MYRIKICGITNPTDAQIAGRLGADAIGVNFWPGSKRCVTVAQAREIAAVKLPNLSIVGVFVNATLLEIERVRSQVGLDAVQLHGDETVDFSRGIPGPVIRAFRPRGPGDRLIDDYLRECDRCGWRPDAALVDTYRPGEPGGTGSLVDLALAAEAMRALRGFPVLLAGGLDSANVAAAIAVVGPFGVDVASGVEQTPGIKSPQKMEAFVSAARAALGV